MKTHPHGIDIIISDERKQLLETGGGLMAAKHLIPDDPFLCVNSDNLWIDGPTDALHLLAARWNDAAMDALLLVVPQARAHNHNGRGDFHLDPLGRITRRKVGRVAPFVYTGIQMISKRLLNDAPEGPFSTMLFWERAIAVGVVSGWFIKDYGSTLAPPLPFLQPKR